MGMGQGMPVDMDAIDAMAATATEGADRGDQTWEGLQQGFLNSGGVGRAANFGQGAIEGRAALTLAM